MRKQVISAVKHFGGNRNARLAALMAVSMVMGSNGEELCRLEQEVPIRHHDWLFSLMWISLFGMTLLGALSLAWVIVVVCGKCQKHSRGDELAVCVLELETENDKLKSGVELERSQVSCWMNKSLGLEDELRDVQKALGELQDELLGFRQTARGQGIETLSDLQKDQVARRVCTLEFGFTKFGAS